MEKFIPTPTISEILKEEFMDPLGLSAYRLAKDIHVPVSRIQEILNGTRSISVRYIVAFSKILGVSEGYFLRLQMDVDLRTAKLSEGMDEVLSSITLLCFIRTRRLSIRD